MLISMMVKGIEERRVFIIEFLTEIIVDKIRSDER